MKRPLLKYYMTCFAATVLLSVLALASPEISSAQGMSLTTAESRLSKGMEYFKNGKFWEALVELEDVSREYPRHPLIDKIHYMLGYSYIRVGKAEEAEKALEKALAESKDNPDVLLALAQARIMQEKYDKAVVTLEQYLKKNAGDGDSLGTLCNVYLRMEKYDESEACLARLVRQVGENPEYLYQYGVVLLHNGKSADALTVLKKARGLNPDIENVGYYIGLAAYQSGNIKTAMDEFRSLYEQGKADANVLGVLGAIAVQAEDYKNAEMYFQKALALSPDDRTILNNLVLSKVSLGKVDDCVALLQKELKKSKNDTGILNMLASVYLQFEKYDEGKKILEQLVKLEPGNAEYLKILASIYDQGFDTEKIISTWKSYLKLKPDDAEARTALAKALKKSGDKEAALAEYEKIIKKNPKDESALHEAGMMCENLQKIDRAVEIYKKMEPLFPNSAFPSARLGMISEQKGDVESADRFFSAAIKKADMKELYVYNHLAKIRYDQGRKLEAEMLYRQGLENILKHTQEVFMDFMSSMEKSGGSLDLMKLIEISEREKGIDEELDASLAGVHACFSDRNAQSEEVDYLVKMSETYKSNKKPALFAARLLKDMGDPQNRIMAICELILKIDVKEKEAHMLMGWSYDRSGDVKEAGKAYKRAVEADPENEESWRALIENYGRQNRTGELLTYARQKLKDQKTSELISGIIAELEGGSSDATDSDSTGDETTAGDAASEPSVDMTTEPPKQ